MNKIIKTLITITITLSFIGCADKVPFKEQSPMANSTLVYVYANKSVQNEEETTVGKYALQIDRVAIGTTLVEGEYTAINLKSKKEVQISATRSALITKDIFLHTKTDAIYFIRINTLAGGTFELETVDKNIGLKEIKKTTLSGATLEEQIDSYIVEDKEPLKVKKSETSKTQKIKEAYQLKKDGIITGLEFDKLKAEIIDAK